MPPNTTQRNHRAPSVEDYTTGAPAVKRRNTRQHQGYEERIADAVERCWSDLAPLGTIQHLIECLRNERISPPPESYIFEMLCGQRALENSRIGISNHPLELEVLFAASSKGVLPSQPLPAHLSMTLLESVEAVCNETDRIRWSPDDVYAVFFLLWGGISCNERQSTCNHWQTTHNRSPILWALLNPAIIPALEQAGFAITPEQTYTIPLAGSMANTSFWAHVTASSCSSCVLEPAKLLLQIDTWTLAGLEGLLSVRPSLMTNLLPVDVTASRTEMGYLTHWLVLRRTPGISSDEETQLLAARLSAPAPSVVTSEGRSLLELALHPADGIGKPHLLRCLLEHIQLYPEDTQDMLQGGWACLTAFCYCHEDADELSTQDILTWSGCLHNANIHHEWAQLPEVYRQQCHNIFEEAILHHTERAMRAAALIPIDILEQLVKAEYECHISRLPHGGVPRWLLQHPVEKLGPSLQRLLLAYTANALYKPSKDPELLWLSREDLVLTNIPVSQPASITTLLHKLLQKNLSLDSAAEIILHAASLEAPYVIDALEDKYGLMGLEANDVLAALDDSAVAFRILWNSHDKFYITIAADRSYPQASEPPSRAWLSLTTLLVANRTLPDGISYEPLCLAAFRAICNAPDMDELLIPIGESVLWRVNAQHIEPLDCAKYLHKIINSPALYERGRAIAQALWDKLVWRCGYVGTITLLCEQKHAIAQEWALQCLQHSTLYNYPIADIRYWTALWCQQGPLMERHKFLDGLQMLTSIHGSLSIGGVPAYATASCVEPAAFLLMRHAPDFMLQMMELWDPKRNIVGFFIALLAAGRYQSTGTVAQLASKIPEQQQVCFWDEWQPHITSFLDSWDEWHSLSAPECLQLIKQPLQDLTKCLPEKLLRDLFEHTMHHGAACGALIDLGIFSSVTISAEIVLKLIASNLSDSHLLSLTMDSWQRGAYSSERVKLILQSAIMGRDTPQWAELVGGKPEEVAACDNLRAAYIQLAELHAVTLTSHLWRQYCQLTLSDWLAIAKSPISSTLWWPQWWNALCEEGQRAVAAHMVTLALEVLRPGQKRDAAYLGCLFRQSGETFLRALLQHARDHLDQLNFNSLEVILASDTRTVTPISPWLRPAFLERPAIDWGVTPSLQDAISQLHTLAHEYCTELEEPAKDATIRTVKQLESYLKAPKSILDTDLNPLDPRLFEAWRTDLQMAVRRVAGRLQVMHQDGLEWQAAFSNLLACVVCPAGTLTDLQDLLADLNNDVNSIADVIQNALCHLRRQIINGYLDSSDSINPLNSPHIAQVLQHLLGALFLGAPDRRMSDAMGLRSIILDTAEQEVPANTLQLASLVEQLLLKASAQYSFYEAVPMLCSALVDYPSFAREYAASEAAKSTDSRMQRVTNDLLLPAAYIGIPTAVWDSLYRLATKIIRMPVQLRQRLQWRTVLGGMRDIVIESQKMAEGLGQPKNLEVRIAHALTQKHDLSTEEQTALRVCLGSLRAVSPHLNAIQEDSVCWSVLLSFCTLNLPSSWVLTQDLELQAKTAAQCDVHHWEPTELGLREELLLIALQELQTRTPSDEINSEHLMRRCLQRLVQRTEYLDAISSASTFLQQAADQNFYGCRDFIAQLLVGQGFIRHDVFVMLQEELQPHIWDSRSWDSNEIG